MITKVLLREGEKWFHIVYIASIRKLTVASEKKKANCEGVAGEWNSWNTVVHVSNSSGVDLQASLNPDALDCP